MNNSSSRFLKNLINIAVVSLFTCVFLFVLFHLVLGKIQLDTFSASGTFFTVLLTFGISFLWLFCFWFFDFENRKPFVYVFCSFLAGFLLQFCLERFFDRFFFGMIMSSGAVRAIMLLKGVLIPSLSFFISFWIFTGRIYNFSNAIDDIVFGSFTGIGIATAFCIIDFFKFNTVSLQFAAGILISKIVVFSACGVLCFLLVAFSKNVLQKIIAFVSFPLVLFFELFVKLFLRKNIVVSQSRIFEILIPIAFTVVIFALIVFFIWRIGKTDVEFSFTIKRFGISALVMVVFIAGCTLFAHFDSSKTVKIISPNSKISFKLPNGFEKQKKISIESILAVNQSSKVNYVKKIGEKNENAQTINVEVDFAFPSRERFMMEETYFSPVNGCRIYEIPQRPLPPDGKPFDEPPEFRDRSDRPEPKGDKNGKHFDEPPEFNRNREMSGNPEQKNREPTGNREQNPNRETNIKPRPDNMNLPDFKGDEKKTYSVVIQKGENCIALTFDGYGKNRKYVTDVVKLVARTINFGE